MLYLVRSRHLSIVGILRRSRLARVAILCAIVSAAVAIGGLPLLLGQAG
jgi:hypothetical protein